jgi:transposase
MSKTSSSPTVEVISNTRQRRRWTPSEKKLMVEETYTPGVTVSLIARKHGIPASQLFTWRKQYEEGAMKGVETQERLVPESELKKVLERVRRLERLLGQKTEETEILKEAVRIGREKKLISRAPLRGLDDFE